MCWLDSFFSCCIPPPLPGHPAIVSQGEVDELPDLTEAEQVMEKWPDLKGLGEELGGFLSHGGKPWKTLE